MYTRSDTSAYTRRTINQFENKNGHASTVTVLAVAFVIIASWLLSTTTPLPAQACNQSTFTGTYGSIGECK